MATYGQKVTKYRTAIRQANLAGRKPAESDLAKFEFYARKAEKYGRNAEVSEQHKLEAGLLKWGPKLSKTALKAIAADALFGS